MPSTIFPCLCFFCSRKTKRHQKSILFEWKKNPIHCKLFVRHTEKIVGCRLKIIWTKLYFPREVVMELFIKNWNACHLSFVQYKDKSNWVCLINQTKKQFIQDYMGQAVVKSINFCFSVGCVVFCWNKEKKGSRPIQIALFKNVVMLYKFSKPLKLDEE